MHIGQMLLISIMILFTQNNMKYFSFKTTLFFLLGFIFVGIFVILLFRKNLEPKTTTTTVPKPLVAINKGLTQENFVVINLSPDGSTILAPHTKQEFSITFSNTVKLRLVTITLSLNLENNEVRSIPISTTLSTDKKTIRILPIDPIQPDSDYNLSVKNATTGKTILAKAYISDVSMPTPVPSNNLSLAKYLPYQTKNFLLEYVPSLNVYLFHFLIDASSTDDLTTQFNKAKNDATDYIKSKGIDPSTLVIEWKNS